MSQRSREVFFFIFPQCRDIENQRRDVPKSLNSSINKKFQSNKKKKNSLNEAPDFCQPMMGYSSNLSVPASTLEPKNTTKQNNAIRL